MVSPASLLPPLFLQLLASMVPPILAPYCAAAGLVVMEYWTSRAIQQEIAGEWEQVYRNYPYSGFDEDGKYSFNNDIIDI